LNLVLFIVSVLVTATLFALVEVQIDGADGWASRLPTWRIHNRWTRLIMSGKPLTGYHLYLLIFIAAILHSPYGIGLCAWSARAEARTLSFMCFFWVAEDFLWFVLNPHFGLRGFRRDRVWWHAPAWWWIMPRDYWLSLPIGAALYAYSIGMLN